MKTVHEEVRKRIALQTKKYAQYANLHRKDKQFEASDLVMVRLRSERFPPGSYSKLHARHAGPFQVVKKISPNTYVINLPHEYTISPIFNVKDLIEFKGERVSPFPDLDTTIRVPDVPKWPDTASSLEGGKLMQLIVRVRVCNSYYFIVKFFYPCPWFLP
ncbi:hypothetical protein ACOSQ4_021196 [Xanthoceras sorbifolium]